VGFSNLRARAETASPRAIGSPHRPTSHDVPPFLARKKGLVSLTLPEGHRNKASTSEPDRRGARSACQGTAAPAARRRACASPREPPERPGRIAASPRLTSMSASETSDGVPSGYGDVEFTAGRTPSCGLPPQPSPRQRLCSMDRPRTCPVFGVMALVTCVALVRARRTQRPPPRGKSSRRPRSPRRTGRAGTG
jgi:hypothetical protein